MGRLIDGDGGDDDDDDDDFIDRRSCGFIFYVCVDNSIINTIPYCFALTGAGLKDQYSYTSPGIMTSCPHDARGAHAVSRGLASPQRGERRARPASMSPRLDEPIEPSPLESIEASLAGTTQTPALQPLPVAWLILDFWILIAAHLSNMTILNVHAGSIPSFALRLKSTDTLTTLRQRAAAKVRLQLSDGIPLAVKYGWNGQRYSLEDDDDWEIFSERVSSRPEADGE